MSSAMRCNMWGRAETARTMTCDMPHGAEETFPADRIDGPTLPLPDAGVTSPEADECLADTITQFLWVQFM